MIKFEKFELSNGLRVIFHEDRSTPLVAVNVLYDVGAKDESPERTGFAHLFEHLMFGGSINVPDFDEPIQNAGGENNAFTNSDITNFYEIVPAKNIEIPFWLESDRMLQLAFSEKSLEVQKKVVVEEFKETSLNRPYGDIWHKLTALAYKKHPYRWPTIGLKPEHISEAEMKDVQNFFYKHYRPKNAILVVAGNSDLEAVKEMSQKWFGPIPSGEKYERDLPQEVEQVEGRMTTVHSNVPADALYMCFPMVGRKHKDFPIYDLLSDVLSGGDSSRFHVELMKGTSIFSSVSASITGAMDPGLFIIEGKLLKGADIDDAIAEIWKQLELIKNELVSQRELQTVQNKFVSSTIYSDVSILNKAINLAYYELLGDAELINKQEEIYTAVTAEEIQNIAKSLFIPSKLNQMKYLREEA